MGKPEKGRKRGPAVKTAAPARSYSPAAQELRALLRRVPDGLKATLQALEKRELEERERVLAELARGMGKEVLPLFRSAALGSSESVAVSAVKLLPLFGTRAAADILAEAYQARPEGPVAEHAWQGAKAFGARGISVAIPQPEAAPDDAARYTLRDAYVSVPDGVGSRSVAARLQDQYGVWHAVLVLWNDQAGVKDGFMRPMSRQEWQERLQRMDDRGLPQSPCPIDYARWQVETGRRLNAETGLPLRDYLKEWDELVGPPAADYQPPDPLAQIETMTDEERRAVLQGAPELFTHAEVKRWFLEAGDCAPWAAQWNNLQHRLRLRGASEALEAEIRQVVADAATALMDARQRGCYRGRLLDLARIYDWRRQPALARLAAVAAWSLESDAPVGANPFCVALVERSVIAAALMLQRGEDLERLRYRPARRYTG